MWTKSLKVGDPLFLISHSNRGQERDMIVVKVGRKYLYAAPSLDSHEYQRIKISLDTGLAVESSYDVYQSRAAHADMIRHHKLRRMASEALTYKAQTADQINAIADILGLSL